MNRKRPSVKNKTKEQKTAEIQMKYGVQCTDWHQSGFLSFDKYAVVNVQCKHSGELHTI